MSTKVGVLILHGIGNQDETYADDFMDGLRKHFISLISSFHHSPETQIEMVPVFWGGVFNEREDELWSSVNVDDTLNYASLRQFVIRFFGDAIAYQPAPASFPHLNPNYERVHEAVAKGLHTLSQKAGETSPLTVVSHSLGTVISSNYFYDLQFLSDKIPESINSFRKDNPLENGETLANFYTMGTPIPLWTLRYADFDNPICVPSPHLQKHYPSVKGEWVNFYDKDDAIAYPLRSLNDQYKKSVTKDMEVNSGNLLASWSPLSHMYYFKTEKISEHIGKSLAALWKKANNISS